MAKDYKNRSQRHQQKRKSDYRYSGGGNALSWILAGILIGVLVGGIAYFKLQGLRVMTPETTTEANVQTKTEKTRPEKTKPEPKKEIEPAKSPQPHFDFYTMLPKVDSAAMPAPSEIKETQSQTQSSASLPSEQQPSAKTTGKVAGSNEPPPDDAINQVVAKIEQKEKAEKVKMLAKKESPSGQELSDLSTDSKNRQFIKKEKIQPSGLTKETEKHTAVDIITLEKQRLEQELSRQVDVSAKAAKPTSGRIMLALGTFKEQKAAEQQKAYLLLEGFNVSIKKIQKGNVVLYRLLMGPYATAQAAKDEQKRLQDQSQIDSVIAK